MILSRLVLSLLVLAACSQSSEESPLPAGPGGRTSVVMLGTGTPNADPDRSGPAVAVVVDSTAYLVDAGPGVVRRAAAAWRSGVPALEPSRLNRVFVTHLHSDHTVGLPDLLLTPWVLERPGPLEVYGPPGIADMMHHIEAAWARDIDIRLNGLEPRENTEAWRADVHEVSSPGIVYRDSLVTVTAVPVHHGSWPVAWGYRFQTPDRVIVISGDATPTAAIAEACSGCDVLVHEVYSARTFQGRSGPWQRYHADFHTSTTELAKLATEARPKLLVLYHQLYWGATDEDLVNEVKAAGYAGKVVSGRDLERY